MNTEEIEQYILNKSFVKKTLIPKWKYIRFTVYSQMFASIGETYKGTVLTVWGTFKKYISEYNKIILPAIDNEPKCFTSLILKNANQIPNYVIKTMIDYAYSERQKDVPTPVTATEGYQNIKYCAIPPLSINIPQEDFPTLSINSASHNEELYNSTMLQSSGKWNDVPYRKTPKK